VRPAQVDPSELDRGIRVGEPDETFEVQLGWVDLSGSHHSARITLAIAPVK